MFSLYSWLSLARVQLNTAVHRSSPQSSDARRASPFASIGRAELSPSGSTISEKKNNQQVLYQMDKWKKWLFIWQRQQVTHLGKKENNAWGQWSIDGLTKTKLSLIWITNLVYLREETILKLFDAGENISTQNLKSSRTLFTKVQTEHEPNEFHKITRVTYNQNMRNLLEAN